MSPLPRSAQSRLRLKQRSPKENKASTSPSFSNAEAFFMTILPLLSMIFLQIKTKAFFKRRVMRIISVYIETDIEASKNPTSQVRL